MRPATTRSTTGGFSGEGLLLDFNLSLIKEPHLRAWALLAARAIAPSDREVQLFLQEFSLTSQAFDRGIALDDHGLQGLDIVR